MIYDAQGRRLIRSIGFEPEWRFECEPSGEICDAVSSVYQDAERFDDQGETDSQESTE